MSTYDKYIWEMVAVNCGMKKQMGVSLAGKIGLEMMVNEVAKDMGAKGLADLLTADLLAMCYKAAKPTRDQISRAIIDRAIADLQQMRKEKEAMLPHSGFDIRHRTKRGFFSRFNMTRPRARKALAKVNKETDPTLYEKLVAFLKGT